MAGEIPLLVKTGEEIGDGKIRIGLTELVRGQAEGTTFRVPLTLEGVQNVLQDTMGAMLPQGVIHQVGLDNLQRWEAIWHPNALSLVLVGGNTPEGQPLRLEDALGTITVIRGIHYGTQYGEPTTRFEATRIAGISPVDGRVIETTYWDPQYLHFGSPYYTPEDAKRVVLGHVGFSVSNGELPEQKKLTLGVGIYSGKDVKDNDGRTIYTPCYYTFPLEPTEVDALWARGLVSPSSGALITSAMVAKAGEGGNPRIVMAEFQTWAHRSDFPPPEHRLYLGGETDDPASLCGFYAATGDYQVHFGRHPARRGGSPRGWDVHLPVQLSRAL